MVSCLVPLVVAYHATRKQGLRCYMLDFIDEPKRCIASIMAIRKSPVPV